MSGSASISRPWLLAKPSRFLRIISPPFPGISCSPTPKASTWAALRPLGPLRGAPRGPLHCIDPSSTLAIARKPLADRSNVQFHHASVAASGLPPSSQDFGYSLGVLHQVPDTAAAICSCADLLKPGATLLLYLYYAFDNRPRWFRLLWSLSNAARLLIRRLSPRSKQLVTDLIALTVYWPLSRLASLAEAAGLPVASFPLGYYLNCSF